MLSALGPVLVYGSLNLVDIGFVDDSFSNGQGKHNYPIAEKNNGRQQKMNGIGKNFYRDFAGRKICQLWVEMKNRGLKIAEILGVSTY